MSRIKLNYEIVPFPLVFVGCSDPFRGLLFWFGDAESLCTASLLVAASRFVAVRSEVSSALVCDDGRIGCVCEMLRFVSLPLLVVVKAVDVVVVVGAVLLVLAVVVEAFVRLVVVVVVVEISVSRLFPELAFPFTALVDATSPLDVAVVAAPVPAAANDDTPLSERISLSASDDCS